MNGKRFDRLTRDVAASASRRRLLGALLAGALGGLRLHMTAADDSGTVIVDASGGNHNRATASDPDTTGNDHDRDDEEKDDNNERDREKDGCTDANCPADQSTASSGSGRCCDDEFCSCGGECCGGPECWIFTPDNPNQDEIVVIETCVRPTGCLQCKNSGGRCCEDCTKHGDCLPPCIECPGAASSGVCCSECIDEATKCHQPPDNTPIGGGSIRRR